MHSFITRLCAAVALACALPAFGAKPPKGIPAEAERRYDYFYAEATKHKLAGRHDEAFLFYQHCLDIKPRAAEALYQLGLYYLSLNDSAHCAGYLSAAVEADPANVYYKEAFALFLLRHRDERRAARVLEDMVKCNPARTDVLAQLVTIYTGHSDYEKAIHALDRIETLEGKSFAISMEKFKLYRELGQTEKGFQELEALANENPNDLTYRVLIGDQYMLVDQPEKAWKIYEQVEQAEPRNMSLRMSKLDYYRQTGQDSLCAAMFDSLLFGPDTDEQARNMLLHNYLVDQVQAQTDTAEVLATMDRLFRSVPETTEMLRQYASYLQKNHIQGRLENAFERMLKLEPDNPLALFHLTRLAYEADNYALAVDRATRGITHHPDELLYYFYLGYSYFQLDQLDHALDVFRKGVRQVGPETDRDIVSDMYSIMGDLYYRNGMRDSAFMAYDSCLVYNSSNVGCLNNYAYYLSLEKLELDKAEEMSHRAIMAEPSNKTFIDTYAWVLFVKGKYAEAKLYMERVLTGDFANDEDVSGGVLEHAGDIYACCGELDKALKYWELARAKGGDTSDLLEKKIRLKKYIAE